MNPILRTDSYKVGHPAMFPPAMSYSHFYIEPRSSKVFESCVFFGLQMILKKYFSTPITHEDVLEAQRFTNSHLGREVFPIVLWNHIVETHDGKLPIIIKAPPEGSVIPVKNVVMTIESTDPKCAWLPGWLETQLLRVWYPITVATKSYYVRKLIYDALSLSSDNPDDEIWYKLHDFGARACSSSEHAEFGGAAHLANFVGSDTMEGVYAANKYYDSVIEYVTKFDLNYSYPMLGRSIPASEHSVTTSFGSSLENEKKAYRHFMNSFLRENQMLACVVDSYDSDRALKDIFGSSEFVELIKSRNGIQVIRVDSGDPVQQVMTALQVMQDKFGYVINSKGYRVLNNIRVVQGDGIDEEIIGKILKEMLKEGYSISNITFGMGGNLLQKVNRDTLGFAMKLSNVTVKGNNYDVCKDPVTDPQKKSKEGRLGLFKNEYGEFETRKLEEQTESSNLLRTVFCNGDLLIDESMTTIRERLWNASPNSISNHDYLRKLRDVVAGKTHE